MNVIDHGFGIVEYQNSLKLDDNVVKAWVAGREDSCASDFWKLDDGSRVDVFGKIVKSETQAKPPIRYFNLGQNTKPCDKELLSTLVQTIKECLIDYASKFFSLPRSLWWSSSPSLAVYDKGCHMKYHHDNEVSFKGKRTSAAVGAKPNAPVYNLISASLILTDTSTGGELCFLNADKKIKGTPGTVFLFPSNYLGVHSVQPVLTGQRSALLQFFGHGDLTHGTRELHLPL